VTFPEPLDRALLARVVTIHDDRGAPIAGHVAIDADETRWRLTPDQSWRPGDYVVSASKDLEDLVGNGIRRPFEVDVFETVQRQPAAETVTVPFRVGNKR
jgi:hypothetical protein